MHLYICLSWYKIINPTMPCMFNGSIGLNVLYQPLLAPTQICFHNTANSPFTSHIRLPQCLLWHTSAFQIHIRLAWYISEFHDTNSFSMAHICLSQTITPMHIAAFHGKYMPLMARLHPQLSQKKKKSKPTTLVMVKRQLDSIVYYPWQWRTTKNFPMMARPHVAMDSK